MSVHPEHTRYSERSSSAWMASMELAAMAWRVACGLPPRPACAEPAVASATEAPRTMTSAVCFIDLRSMFRVLRLVARGFVFVLAEEVLPAHVDVENEQVVL